MSSIRSYSRRAGSLFAVAALTLATITPGLVPSFASAAQLTERSVKVSSASKEATGVSYEVTFTPKSVANAVVIDFCSNSPLLEAACTSPAGFSVTGAASAGNTVNAEDANTLSLSLGSALVVDTPVTIIATGITNPTASGPLYARIVTYTTANLESYTDAENLGTYADNGSAAISITDAINVSGAVLETLTFCVAGPGKDVDDDPVPTVINPGCVNSADPETPLPAPSLKLGEKSGSVIALDANNVSTGSLYSQISTNAASGAVVNLKSSAANCGGLLRAGAPSACDIAPAGDGTSTIAAGQAKFGVKVTATAGGVGSLLAIGSYANASSNYALNYVANQSTGVTSTYGDPLFGTDGAPASNKNLEITFGASVAPNTPAGNYSAELSLIATGKF